MHKNILESERYPEVSFVPDRVSGALSKANVHGTFRIHGKDHEMTMVVEAVPAGNRLEVRTQFVVPYVAWGMKNPSTLILRVGEPVTIEVHSIGLVQSDLRGEVGTAGMGLEATSRWPAQAIPFVSERPPKSKLQLLN